MSKWRGVQVIVVGAARQGLALARYLARHGARVTLNDQRSEAELQAARSSLEAQLSADRAKAGGHGLGEVRWACGGHPFEILDGADLVCPSGGVSLDLPLVAEARRRGIPLSNDSQIFLEAAPCRTVGITGSAGKTTTTTLVGRMAEAAKGSAAAQSGFRNAYVGGNIGIPLISVVDEMQPDDLAILELSSFQLEIMTRSPRVAAILNITPNHLDRHGTMAAYIAAKRRILDFQSGQDVAVLGRDDPNAWALRDCVKGRLLSFGLGELPAGSEGTFLRGEELVLRSGGGDTALMERSQIRLRGEHNLLNVLAACAVAAAAGLPAKFMAAGVADFTGVAHRLQYIRSWGGADWYNDSIATAPERVLAALRSFSEPLVLLAGGRDKNLPWDEFAALVQRRVDHLVVFGEAAEIILQAMQAAGPGRPLSGPTITRCATLKEAVAAAASFVEPGDVVLLSPGGTSFDEFRDFEERGEWFARLVNELS